MDQFFPSEERLLLMHKGAEQLHRWLKDIIHTGILEQDFSEDSLSEVAARMVDAKMGSIGRRIRQLAYLDRSNPQWADNLMQRLAQLYLFTINFKKLSTQTQAMQMTLLTWAGLNIRKKDLNPEKGIEDVWYVVGLDHRQEEQLNIRKTWLVGMQSKRFAALIDFAFGRTKFDVDYSFGPGFRGRLNYFPSTFPLRAALFSVEQVKLSQITFPAFDSIDGFLDQFAAGLAKNPWLDAFPCSLQEVRITYESNDFFAVDAELKQMPLRGQTEVLWSLLSVAAGKSIRIFGEWNGHSLKVMSWLESGKVLSLNTLKI